MPSIVKKKTTSTKKQLSPKAQGSIAKHIESLKVSATIGLHEILPQMIVTYGEYTLEDRAVPAFQDGLKPSQRRLLWTMYRNGYFPQGNSIKSANIVGRTMIFHPHGSAYDSLCNMIEGTPCPMVIGQGNFGSFSDAMPAAAERYTEAKLSKFTMAVLFDKRMAKAFPTVPNYDGSDYEPVYLPAMLPLILARGQEGVAVGATTDLPSFTIQSLLAATKLALKAPEYLVPAKVLAKTLVMTPRNNYGGVLKENKEAMSKLITTGIASFDWECDWTMTGDVINIVGIPPGKWNFDNKLEAINEISEVAEAVDISEGQNIHVRITFRRVAEAAKDKAISKVLKMLKSKTHYKTNVTLRYKQEDEIVDFTKATFGSMSVQTLLQLWTKHRVEMEAVAIQNEIDELHEDLARHELLKLAANSLDIIFGILKQKGVDKTALLSKKLKISDEQADEIWRLAVGRLDRLSATKIETTIKEVKANIKTAKDWLKRPSDSVQHHLSLNLDALMTPQAYEVTAAEKKKKKKK